MIKQDDRLILLRKKKKMIDIQIVKILQQRAKIVKTILSYKKTEHLPIIDHHEENAVKKNVQKRKNGPLNDNELLKIFSLLINIMRKK